MKLEIKGNINYSAVIVKIEKLVPLANCDNIQHTLIFGNNVIVSKDIKIEDIGIFFPVECQISGEFLRVNNLYRDATLNTDQTKKGFFELNGRVRCVKFRGNKSEGFFVPIDSLLPLMHRGTIKEFKVGDTFDTINDNKICEKYIIPRRQCSLEGNKKGRKAKISKIVKGQFRFHIDTEKLERNLDKFSKDTLVQISVKVHGTSAISSNTLCYKKLNIFQKLLLKVGLRLEITYHDNIFSSRRVIKNDDINKTQHFYSESIWKKGNDTLKDFIEKGMTIYYEIVGYLSDGREIQKGYDYGCEVGKFDIYIYRITHTNVDGRTYEFSADQIQLWCKQKGLKPVIELYKGTVEELFKKLWVKHCGDSNGKNREIIRKYECREFNIDSFFNLLKTEYLENNCPYCKNIVPFEGIVIRRLDTLDFEAYKLKSTAFLERETKLLDKEEVDIEELGIEENNSGGALC